MDLITTDGLKDYALWVAGEPTDGSSNYNDVVLIHMQFIYDLFVTGGTFGTRDVATSAGLYEHFVDIPMTDWLWLRKHPPFAFVTTPANIGSSSSVPLNQGSQIGTATLTYGSTTVTFSIAPNFPGIGTVAGARLKILTQEQGVPNPPITVPRIATHLTGQTTAFLDAPWPQETQTVSNFAIFRAEYPVPADFERFCEAWKVQGGYLMNDQPLNVGSNEQVFDNYPMSEYNYGPPSMAARLNPTTIMMNRWDTFSYRIEGSYVFTPTALALAQLPLQQPVIPTRFRATLALGAAMMIAQDKLDSSRVGSLSSEFRELVHLMAVEYRKEQNSGSELAGRQLYRQGSNFRRRGLKSASGLPIF